MGYILLYSVAVVIIIVSFRRRKNRAGQWALCSGVHVRSVYSKGRMRGDAATTNPSVCTPVLP